MKTIGPHLLANVILCLLLSTASAVDPKEPEARALLRSLCVAVDGYHTEYNQWPNEAGIFTTLEGDNPRQIRFLEPPKKSIRPGGIIVDPWGHPVVFDGIIKGKPHFHSAGPDGIDQHGNSASDDVVSWR